MCENFVLFISQKKLLQYTLITLLVPATEQDGLSGVTCDVWLVSAHFELIWNPDYPAEIFQGLLRFSRYLEITTLD